MSFEKRRRRRVLVFLTNKNQTPCWSTKMIITVISKKSKNLRFKCNFRFRKLWFLISFDHMDKKPTLSFDPIDPWRTFNYSLNYYLASFRYSKKGEIRKFQEKLVRWPICRKISKISRKGMFICFQKTFLGHLLKSNNLTFLTSVPLQIL